MIIDRMILHNVGVFGGTHEIDLTPPSSSRPVILIGGLNGAGKTTLLDALQLGFFGRSSEPVKRNPGRYQDYLARLIHNKTKPRDGAAIEILFRATDEGTERSYRLQRNWVANNGGAKENISIEVDEIYDSVLSETWAEQVERFIPTRLSQLFFFDGEQIEDLATPERSARMVETAIKALLGLDLVDQLQIDLKVLKRRKQNSTLTESTKETIRPLENELIIVVSKFEKLTVKRGALESQRDNANTCLEKAKSSFAAQGGNLLLERRQLEEHRKSIVDQLSIINRELIDLASGLLPFWLVNNDLQEIIEQSRLENSANQRLEYSEYTSKRDARMLKHFRRQGMTTKAMAIIQEFIKEEKISKPSLVVDAYLNMDSNTQNHLDVLLGSQLDKENSLARKSLESFDRLHVRLDEVDGKLARVPDEESLEKILREQQQAEQRKELLSLRIKDIDEEIRSAERQRNQLCSKIDNALRLVKTDDLGRNDAERHIECTDHLDTLLEQFRSQILKSKIQFLEKQILHCFVQLLRKKTLIINLKIDIQSFTLELFDSNNKPITSDQLSAGERQLLAVAILWGLSLASGRPIPVVIDTPLGRLDSSHRENLVKDYFGKASHQVILLSTDEEIMGPYLKMLEPSIGRIYKVEYDERKGISTIKSGYF